MKRLFLVAAALMCVCGLPCLAQQIIVTATLTAYAGTHVLATSSVNGAHSGETTVGPDGRMALRLYQGEPYVFFVSAINNQPAFSAYWSTPATASAEVSSVMTAAAAAAATSTGAVTSAALQGLSPALGVTTTASINNVMVADQAVSGAGKNGLANLYNGICALSTTPLMCSVYASPQYSAAEFSRFFTVANNGNDDFYQTFPVLGGLGGARFSEDRRLANLFYSSINAQPLGDIGLFNGIVPYVFEARSSNQYNYADNRYDVLLRQRIFGAGHNYTVAGVSEKANYSTLFLDSRIATAMQGGGTIATTSQKTAPGDDMVFTVQHDTAGCNEGEDECDKLFRAFLETSTERWGGQIATAPTLDPLGFGNYTLQATVSGSYNPKQAGEDSFLVNLSRQYTAGNITTITASAYPGLVKISGDTAASWATHFGASTIATLTAAIDAKTYNNSCPSTVTNSANKLPDPFKTDESANGGLAGFCATVSSTTGMADGMKCTIAGQKSNLEQIQLVHVVDGTHVTLNAGAPHDINETIMCGGAGYHALSKTEDDIAIGGLTNYYTQPKVVLHKFYPVAGSDSGGNLYVYLNTIRDNAMFSFTYANNVPNVPAVLSATAGGGGIATISVTNGSVVDYYNAALSGMIAGGQTALSMPTLSFPSCTVAPTYTAAYTSAGNRLIPSFTITAPGTCSGTTVTAQTVWPIPYRITPFTMTKKVVDPATGSSTNGTLITGNLNPSDWQTGDTIEIPAWPHDDVRSLRLFGKYLRSGQSSLNGLVDGVFYAGDWAKGDILAGIENQTDGHKYYPDATHPIGPGVAYETPPDGYGFEGNFDVDIPVALPPKTAFAAFGCGQPPDGKVMFHPCLNGIASPFTFFSTGFTVGTQFHRHNFSFDGIDTLSWDGFLILGADPVAPMQAATKEYVDAKASSVGAATYYQTQGSYGTGPAVGIANHVICSGFVVPAGGWSVGRVAVGVGTGDGGSGATSDFGFYSKTGMLLAHIGAQSLPYGIGSYTNAFAGGTVTIPAGPIYACYTSTSTALVLATANQSPSFYPAADIGQLSTNGVLNSTITPPADNPATTYQSAGFVHFVLLP